MYMDTGMMAGSVVGTWEWGLGRGENEGWEGEIWEAGGAIHE
jgi:hypothetical protein